MRRLRLVLCIVMLVVVSGCGADDAATGQRVLPTPRPAPTVAGQSVEIELPEFTNQAVIVGLSQGETLTIRARPGFDEPVVGEAPAGSDDIILLGEAFATDDGSVWWLVQHESAQGWVPPDLAFLGQAEELTDQVGQALGAGASFDSIEELALAAADVIASNEGASRVVTVSSSTNAERLSGNAVVDVLGVAESTRAGVRLIVTGAGSTSGTNPYTLVHVQQITLCAQNVTGDGRCT